MLRLLLSASLVFLTGCAFLDDDLLLDEEEFEESFWRGSGGTYGYGTGGGSSNCGGRVRMGRMTMGNPTIGRYEVSGYRGQMELEFDADDIDGHAYDTSASGGESLASSSGEPIEEAFEDWHAEFLRAEDGWLQVEAALAEQSDKEVDN